jgi:RNA recognition motif-containing protein
VKKIYVGNLAWSATEAELRDLFSSYGDVASVAIITDRDTGRSRGFGFVELDGDADKAISELDGRELGGRALRVNEAQDKRGGGGGGGGGGRGPRR